MQNPFKINTHQNRNMPLDQTLFIGSVHVVLNIILIFSAMRYGLTQELWPIVAVFFYILATLAFWSSIDVRQEGIKIPEDKVRGKLFQFTLPLLIPMILSLVPSKVAMIAMGVFLIFLIAMSFRFLQRVFSNLLLALLAHILILASYISLLYVFTTLGINTIIGGNLFNAFRIDLDTFFTPLVLVLLVLCILWRQIPSYRGFLSQSIIAALALFFAIVIFTIYGTRQMISPYLFERLISGIADIDYYFHFSLVRSLVDYGLPSTGVDGLNFVQYHWGCHMWLAGLIKSFALPPVYSLPLIEILAFPTLAFFLTSFFLSRSHRKPMFSILATLSILTVMFSEVSSGALISEGAVFALLILLAALAAIFPLDLSKSLSRKNSIGIGLLLGLFLFLLLITKISYGLVLGAVLSGIILFHYRLSLFTFVYAIASGSALLLVVNFFLFDTGERALPFDAFRIFAAIIKNVPALNVVLLLGLIGVLKSESVNKKSLVYASLVILGAAFISTLPNGFMILTGADKEYFSYPGNQIAILFLFYTCTLKPYFEKRKAFLIPAIPFIVTLLMVSRIGILYFSEQSFLNQVATPMELLGHSRKTTHVERKISDNFKNHAKLFAPLADERLVKNAYALLYKASSGLSKDTAILVPEDSIFFDSYGGHCPEASFAIVTITGRPLINGIRNCQPLEYYGYQSFDLKDGKAFRKEHMNFSHVCKRAREKGFQNLLYVKNSTERSLETEHISCALL